MVRVLLVGDFNGIRQALKYFSKDSVIGIMCAAIRPEYIDDIQELSSALNVPMLIQPMKIDTNSYSEFLHKLDALNFDLIFINSYSMKLHSEILKKAKKGTYNVHGGLLPEYRGCSPVQWAILNNETKSGVTLHEVTEEIDCGPIIAKIEVEIGEFETWVEVTDKINLETERILFIYIPLILSGRYVANPQDHRIGKTWPRRYPKDGELAATSPAFYIYNSSRALVHPLPGITIATEEDSKLCYDKYLTLAEIFSLKSLFRENLSSMKCSFGQIKYISPLIFDQPVHSHSLEKEHGELIFSLEGSDNLEIGKAYLYNISLRNRSAKLRIQFLDYKTNTITQSVLAFFKNFIVNELNLKSVSISKDYD